MTIRLFDLPHDQMAAHLDAPVWLTSNPVEFHGPHLSLHNDRLLSLGVARELAAARGWPLVLADDLEVGVSPTPGPGSRRTSLRTMRTLVLEACERLADIGAKRVVLLTFHGDPLHNLALSEGVDALTKRGVRAVAPFNRLLQEMLTLEPGRFAEALAHVDEPLHSEMVRDLKFDFHAGFFETSLALHYAPDSVSPAYRSLPPCPPITPVPLAQWASRLSRALGAKQLGHELRFAAQGLGWHKVSPFPGYTSAPHLATKEAGAIFAREIVSRFNEEIERVFFANQPSPAPVMRWTETATLGGRF